MARLARHADLGPRGGVSAGGGIVVLADVRRVAVRAHVVPVLLPACPVELVAEVDFLVRVEMKPALAARLARARIPGDRQRLEATARQLDQVLLERPHAERVLDLEIGELAVRPAGPDHVAALAPKERGRDRAVGEAAVREIAEHGGLARDLHRPRVIGVGPGGVLLRVAAGTRPSADVGRGGLIVPGPRRARQVCRPGPEVPPGDQGAGREQDQAAGDDCGCSHAVRAEVPESSRRSTPAKSPTELYGRDGANARAAL